MRAMFVEQFDVLLESLLDVWVDSAVLQKLVVIGSMGLAYAGALGFLMMLSGMLSGL